MSQPFLIQGASLKDLKASYRVTEFVGSTKIDESIKKIKSPIIGIQNHKFDLNVINQNRFQNLLSPHPLSNFDILETTDIFRCVKVLNPDQYNFYNEDTEKYSLSLEIITKELFNEEEKHQADEDGIHLLKSRREINNTNPELNTLITYVSNENNKSNLLNSSLLMKPILSPKYGPNTQLISRLSKFDWNNWDVFMTIPDEFNWEGNITDLTYQLKKQAKVSVLKTKIIPILFPNTSKTFKRFYNGYPDEVIEKVIKNLRNDEVFINNKKEELRNKYSKPKERKYHDIFDNSDGFFSPNDRHVSNFFRKADPKTKMTLCNQFEDKRLVTNAKIIMLHNYREFMTPKEIKDIFDYELSELEKTDASRVTFESFLKSYDEVCSDEKWSKYDLTNLNEYKAHVLALRANPKLFLEG